MEAAAGQKNEKFQGGMFVKKAGNKPWSIIAKSQRRNY